MTMTNPHDKRVGENVRVMMTRRDLTQAPLVKALDLSQQALSRRLRGVNAFSVEQVIKLSKALDVPLNEFIDGVPVLGVPVVADSMSISELVGVASWLGVDASELLERIAKNKESLNEAPAEGAD